MPPERPRKIKYNSQKLVRIGECLYRDGNGIIIAKVKIQKRIKKRNLGTTDLAVARQRLQHFRDKLRKAQRKTALPRKTQTGFADLRDEWLAEIEPHLKPASYKRRRTSSNNLVNFFGNPPIRNVGRAKIAEWLRFRKDATPRTYNIDLETLKLIFAYAIDRGIIIDNPTESLQRKKQSQAIVYVPTKKEFEDLYFALLGAPQAKEAANMVAWLAYSGMRVAEAAALEIPDINFEKGLVNITGGKQGTKNHKPRVIPLFRPLRDLAEEIVPQRKKQKERRLFTISSPRGAMKLAFKRTPEIKAFRVHDLRHFFASNVLENPRATFPLLAKWLGHTDGGILAAKTYGHLREDFEKELAAEMTYSAILNS